MAKKNKKFSFDLLTLALVAVGYVIHFKWCRCPHCGDRIRVTDGLMRLPKICPKCHEELK